MNYPDNFNGTNMDSREDNEQQNMFDAMFRNRKHPITVADTVSDPTATMSPLSADLHNCFKSADRKEQLRALNQLRIPINPATLPEQFED